MTRRLALVAAVALLGSAWTGSPASADAPVRTGWWTAATVAGAAAPLPTTADGDLHVASSPQGTLALAALDYHVAPVDTATLVLPITAGSVVGTPALYACPTKDETWKAGGDQPYDTAPVPQCPGRQVQGVVGTDSVTFLLDSRSQLRPGVLSLALVPAAGSTFSMDLTAPGAASLSVVPAEEPAAPADPVAAVPAGPAAAAPAPSPAAAAPVGVAPPAALGPVPALAGVAAAPAAPPQLAAAPSTAPLAAGTVPLQQVASTRPAAPDSGRRLATVLLVALVGAGGYLLGRDERPPLRLLGGRALRAGGPPPPPDGPARGLGRFARPRSGPAHGLR